MGYDSVNKRLSDASSPITLTEIADCIGDYRVGMNGQRDLGLLCSSPNVNKWSRIKPVKLADENPITDMEREIVNYGFKVDDLYYRYKADAFAAIVGEQISYQYEAPSGGDYKYRLRDFNGYWHLAAQPYTVSVIQDAASRQKSISIERHYRADIKLSEFAPYDHLPTALSGYYVVALYAHEGSNAPSIAYFKKADGSYLTITDLDNGHTGSAGFNATLAGKYDIAVCLTSFAESQSETAVSGYYWALPAGKGHCYYEDNYVGVRAENISTVAKNSGGTVIGSASEIVSTVSNSVRIIHNDDNNDYADYRYIIEIGRANNGVITGGESYTDSFGLASPGDSHTVSHTFDLFMQSLELGETGISARLYDLTNEIIYYMDYLNRELVRTEQPVVLLSQITLKQ